MELWTKAELRCSLNKVSIVILNYNGKHFLGPCLDALKEQSMKEFDTIVVDNGSKDGSMEFVKSNYPYVRTIQLSTNTGFCHGSNVGVNASETPYIILLNNDTIPEPDFVKALLQGIEARPEAFACGSCMLTVDDNTILDGAGDLYSAFGWAFARGKGSKAELFSEPCEVFSVCAGAAIYRKNLFKSLGMLDENHFAYLEDLDLCYRAKIEGYQNWYIPTARVVHVGSGTSGSRHNEFKVMHSSRNNVYVVHKNMPLPQWCFNLPLLFIGFAIKTVYFARKGFGKTYLEGIRSGIILARSKKGKVRKIRYKTKNSRNYWKIQMELLANLTKRR